jgi:general secretion pathway protein L
MTLLRPHRRPVLCVLLQAIEREPTPHASLAWALVASDAPPDSPAVEEGYLNGDTLDPRLVTLCREHPAVILLPPNAVSHFSATHPKGIKRSEWPLLIEDRVATEVSRLALAGLEQRPDHLDLVAVERRLLKAWQAWFAERSLSITYWASGFMGMPAPDSPEQLRVLADASHWMIKSLDADEAGVVHWLTWPRVWRDMLPPDLRERHWQPVEGEKIDLPLPQGQRLALFGRHLPARLPQMPNGGAVRRRTGRLAMVLTILLLAHGALGAWSVSQSPPTVAGVTDRLLQRNVRLEAMLERLEDALSEAALPLERFAVTGKRLTISWLIEDQHDPATLEQHLAGLGQVSRDADHLTLEVTLDAAPSTTRDAP